MGGGGLGEARESLRLARLRTLLFALLLVGLPLGITITLIAGRDRTLATTGEQPGGFFHGRLISPDGTPAAGVEIQLIPISLEGQPGEPVRVESEGDGHFRIEAPAHDGKYALGAGGGELRRSWIELSFLDRSGEHVEPAEIELQLEAGCSLLVELVPTTERYIDHGRYELRGRVHSGSWLDLMPSELTVAQEFKDGRIELDGLPAFDGTLQVFLANGDVLELELELEPGKHHRRLEL